MTETERVFVCIEDDEDVRTLFRHAAQSLSAELVEARTVNDGLRLVRERRPDLILLDLILPDRSGWRAVDELRADPLYRQTPIVVVTVMDQDLEKYRGHRVDQVQAFITKPFALAQLERTLAQVLGIPPVDQAP
jgi:CheY-like chemotaxis protein